MRIPPGFFLLLLGFPLLELYLLIKLGTIIGALPTVGVVIGTAVLGLWLMRLQGLKNYQRVQHSLLRGEMPAVELLESAIIFMGGMLLLVPGLVTDVIGLLFLSPPLRRILLHALLRRMNARQSTHAKQLHSEIYEGEYRPLPKDDDGRRKP